MLQASAFAFMLRHSFSLKKPTVVPHHVRIKSSLVLLLHRTNLLVEPFTMLIAYSAQVIGKE